jgi:CHAT domain-containing protein/Tfp pilus assembly protein PilF
MLIVESVVPGFAAERACLLSGDRLLYYNGQPLSSPFVLQALEENMFDEEPVTLAGKREGVAIAFAVKPGQLGIEARPELSAAIEVEYQQGRTAFEAAQYAEAADCWSEAAQRASDQEVSVWLTMKAGEASEQAGDWQSVQFCYERAYEQLAAGQDTAALSAIWTALGRCSQNLSDFEAAMRCYEQAHRLDELANRPLWVARALGNLGNVAFYRGDLALAQDYFTRALAIRERLAPGSLDMAAGLGNLGNVAYQRGDLTSAQDYFTRALSIRERLAPDSLDVASSLRDLGIVAWERGDLPSAQDYFTRALSIRERLAPNSLDVAASLGNLGGVALHRGDLASAQDYHTQALAIRERLAPDSLSLALSLNLLGSVVYQRGDLASAQDYHIRALAIRERLAPGSLDMAAGLGNLGNVAYQRGDLTSAQDYYTQALAIRERLAPNSLPLALSLNNLGLVAIDRGDLSFAQDYHIRALVINERLAPGSLDVAMSLNNLGTVACNRGDLASAHDYYIGALDIQERLAPNSLDTAGCLSELGRTLLLQHRPSDALPHYQHAVRILEHQREQIQSNETRALLLAQHTDKFAGLIQCHLNLHQPHDAFSTLERARARSLLELLAERHLHRAVDAPPQLIQQLQDLDQQRAQAYDQLSRLSATADNTDNIEDLHRTLRELERSQQELTAQIRAASPRYAALQYPQPLDGQRAQQALDLGTLLLSYLVAEKESFLFAVTNRKLTVFTLPVGQKELQEQVQRFREALNVFNLESTPQQAIEQGHALYNLLLAPVQSHIRKAERLLLCPDGPLHVLPFAALINRSGRKPRYLGQEKPLHTTFSMTVYAQATQQPTTTTTLPQPQPQCQTSPLQSVGAAISSALRQAHRIWALGDPLYAPGQGAKPATAGVRSGRKPSRSTTSAEPSAEVSALRSRGLSLHPLPHTRNEVETIGELFGADAIVRTGEQASKTTAKQESGDADIVHFACHGWLDGKMPLSSGLILSQPEALGKKAKADDNGLLQAWEIFEQVKLKADLVVLSCCQSGLGQEVRGEGVIGLTRAFTYAGARSVLVSLWEIHDASTAEFMKQFYTALKAGASKDEALQAAIQVMSAHPRWSHPFYWAAFLLHGDQKTIALYSTTQQEPSPLH